jgi:hypothetical protein
MARRRALGLLLFAGLAVLLYAAIRHTRDLTDFKVYRTAGARVLAAEPLYRPEDGHFLFKYLPAFAYPLIPFAALGAEAAKALWFGLSCAWLTLFMRGAVLALPDRRRPIRVLVALMLCVMAKSAIRELSLGQTNALLGALLLASLAAIERGAPRRAGALAGLAAFVKPYAVVVAPWLPVGAGIRALVAFGAIVTGGLLLPTVTYGWHGNLVQLQAWASTVTGTTAPNLPAPENVSVLSAWEKWAGPGSVTAVLTVTTLVALAVLVGLVVSRRSAARRPAYLEVALLLLLIPLISPQGWDYVLLLGTPAVVCLIDRWAVLSRVSRSAVATALVLIALPLRELFGLAITRQVLDTGVLTVSALVLAVALGEVRWRQAA